MDQNPNSSTGDQAYRAGLSFIHHVGFDFHSKNVNRAVVQLLESRCPAKSLVVELGCGTGLLADSVANAGFRYLGVDYSSAMLAIARKNHPALQFEQSGLDEFELPTCAAVIVIGEVFNYEFDGRLSISTFKKRAKRIYKALEAGGILLFDIAGSGRGNFAENHQRHYSENGWAMLVTTSEDQTNARLTRRMEFFVKQGDTYRRDQETHRLKLFDRSEVTAVLREIGFRVQLRNQLGEERFPPGLYAVIASKPR